jgi:hypothetical protein
MRRAIRQKERGSEKIERLEEVRNDLGKLKLREKKVKQ